MPYFTRRPIQGLVDLPNPTAGLPSRRVAGDLRASTAGAGPSARATPPPASGSLPRLPAEADVAHDIVRQARAVLDADRALGALVAAGPGQVLAGRPPENRHEATALPALETLLALAGRWIGETRARNGATDGTDSTATDQHEPPPTYGPAVPTAAGTRARFAVRLAHDTDADARIALNATELVGPRGNRIAADRIRIEPARLLLAPGSSASVEIVLDIPVAAAAATYSGLLCVEGGEDLCAILRVPVISAGADAPATPNHAESNRPDGGSDRNNGRTT